MSIEFNTEWERLSLGAGISVVSNLTCWETYIKGAVCGCERGCGRTVAASNKPNSGCHAPRASCQSIYRQRGSTLGIFFLRSWSEQTFTRHSAPDILKPCAGIRGKGHNQCICELTSLYHRWGHRKVHTSLYTSKCTLECICPLALQWELQTSQIRKLFVLLARTTCR